MVINILYPIIFTGFSFLESTYVDPLLGSTYVDTLKNHVFNVKTQGEIA